MRRFGMVVVTALVLVACGDDSGGVDVVESAGVDTTSVAGGDDVEGDDAPISIPPTAATEPTAPATVVVTTPEPTVTSAWGRDECLVGSWVMKQDTLDLLLASALPFTSVVVPVGGLTFVFNDDGTVVTDAKFTARFNLADTEAEADVFWLHKGTWATVDGILTIEITEQESGITEVRQAAIAVPGPPLPPITPIAGGPYNCNQSTFNLTISNGATELNAMFER
jgi:hypothetical protein